MTVAKTTRTSARKQPTAAAPPKRAASKRAAPTRTVPAKKPADASAGKSPAHLISARIAALGDWRGEVLAQVRKLIHDAEPEIVEEWKWRGVPVWEHAGIICTGETYKTVVKMTFAKGASLSDPKRLFNSSLEGNTRQIGRAHV